jgi:outer membrane protein assembly factor BamB
VRLMTCLTRCLSILLVLGSVLTGGEVAAADWPLWRYDAGRSAASPDELPSRLSLHWTRRLPRLRPAWPDQPKMTFDFAYEPIVLGQRLFVGSSHDGSVTAYDTRTGDELWRFYTDGPVRFSPAGWQGKLYCVSDDGYLYCLSAADGALIWRFRGGPSDRRILGNERLISTWPARGAPVIEEGTVYFAAGIWPFMGIFLHALDAETGRVVWTNDGDGSRYIKQPHNADSFAGVAPQGALVAVGSKLLIPGGRSVPACYDRASGDLNYYQLAENGKRGGGSTVAAFDRLFFNGGAAFDLETERYLGQIGELFAFADGRLYDFSAGQLRALDVGSSAVTTVETVDRKGENVKEAKWTVRELARAETAGLTALIKAGGRLYAGREARVMAFSLPLHEKGAARIAWEAELTGTPASLVAADGKLLVVTTDGSIHCFAADSAGATTLRPRTHDLRDAPLSVNQAWSARVQSLVRSTGIDDGYCVVWGVGSGGLVRELVRQTALRIIVVEADSKRASEFRRELTASASLADRVSVVVADLYAGDLPPYLASLIVCESLPPQSETERAAFIAASFGVLRPYGGVAALPLPPDRRDPYQAAATPSEFPGLVWRTSDEWLTFAREGALPESADWTHEHADAANTRVSKDKRVKAPLGLLWFGGPPNDEILPRHGHGPQPQVVDGRLIIEGMDMLRAVDIYTGRLLWEAKLPGVGALYDNTAHQPGANSSGTNYIAMPDGIYVAYGDACLRLDPASGKELSRFRLPQSSETQAAPLWGYLNVFGDYLIGGADPLYDASLGKGNAGNKLLKIDNDNFSSSGRLVVMNRHSGKVLWTAQAVNGFRHNGICIGGGRIYCIDRLSGAQLSRYQRRGEKPPHPAQLTAFNLADGAEVWNTTQDVFGTWLSYSNERDVLVEAGRTARDTLTDEPKGMRAYRGSDGEALWENKSYSGPAMIHHETILMSDRACDLLSGAVRMRAHPLSGENVEWTWFRNYGCNTPSASEHLLTFRSGAAGYFDLCNDGGTGNFGGFRSSCTNNLIVAGGVLTAPDYTRTCTCSYQNQTSLALVHQPHVEMWTSFGAQSPKQPVRRLGINLGAPGDRKADDGTLWLDYPSVGGASPVVAIEVEPKDVAWFRRHSSQVDESVLPWVASSGAIGLARLRIQLSDAGRAPHRYTLRLHFLEPEEVPPGERVFGVRVQGQLRIPSLDVRKEAGARNRAVVRELRGVEAANELLIELAADPAAKRPAPVLSGVEVLAEGW